ncbi:MAG: hypothetical protein IJ736_14190, partial [Firmicutes bacterium]|nr:hypothetical protein [Bacillota bacterium]
MILLEILKIVIIVLLAIIGIILGLLLFLLLMNIKFTVSGKYDDEFDMKVYAEYIFKLIMFKFDMKNTDGKYQLLIMGTDYEIWKMRKEKIADRFSQKDKNKNKQTDDEESADMTENSEYKKDDEEIQDEM